MELHIDEIDGIFIFEIAGEVDFGDCRDFEICIQTLVDKGVDRIVFEMSRFDNMVSSGIGTLVWLAGYMRERGGRLALAAVNRRLTLILERLEVTPYFELYPDESSAVAALRGPAPTSTIS